MEAEREDKGDLLESALRGMRQKRHPPRGSLPSWLPWDHILNNSKVRTKTELLMG